jgi:hypothetical protein
MNNKRSKKGEKRTKLTLKSYRRNPPNEIETQQDEVMV